MLERKSGLKNPKYSKPWWELWYNSYNWWDPELNAPKEKCALKILEE